QAEDGIRAPLVTGVQTCALPISRIPHVLQRGPAHRRHLRRAPAARGRLVPAARSGEALRSAAEEARRAERGRAGRRARYHLPDREEPGPVDPAVYRSAVKQREGRLRAKWRNIGSWTPNRRWAARRTAPTTS